MKVWKGVWSGILSANILDRNSESEMFFYFMERLVHFLLGVGLQLFFLWCTHVRQIEEEIDLDCKTRVSCVDKSQVYHRGFWFNPFNKIKGGYARAVTRWKQGWTCFMGWVKCEEMHSKESGIRDESLEGSVIGHLVSKYIGSEFGIRDVFFISWSVLCIFC